MKLKAMKLKPDAQLPARNLSWDAGWDLFASEDLFIPIGATKKIKTAIAIDIPSGFYAKIEDRSSLASKSLRTGAGIVDSGYQGEIQVVMHNIGHSNGIQGNTCGYWVKKGDKVAQIIIHQIPFISEIEEVQSFEPTERGNKGFGSSGR